MTNDQLPMLALEGNRPAVGFCPASKDASNVGMQTVMFASNVRLFDASCNRTHHVSACARTRSD